jgi:hypothetical protein
MKPALINAGDLLSRPTSARGQFDNLNDWIISAAKQPDGQYVVISRYGDDKWQFLGGATNAREKIINFATLPECFRADTKRLCFTDTVSKDVRGSKTSNIHDYFLIHQYQGFSEVAL